MLTLNGVKKFASNNFSLQDLVTPENVFERFNNYFSTPFFTAHGFCADTYKDVCLYTKI